MRSLAVALLALAALAGCESQSRHDVTFVVELEPRPEPRGTDGGYVLHVGDADVEALGLESGELGDGKGLFRLQSDIEVASLSSEEHCFIDDAPVTLEGRRVGVVPAGACVTGGARSEWYTVRVPGDG